MPIIDGGNVIPGDGLTNGVPFTKAGAVVANDFAGNCRVGSLAVDTVAGKLWICTVTNGTTTSTWVVVGSQT